MPSNPEQFTRGNIDQMLKQSAWAVQDYMAFDSAALIRTLLHQLMTEQIRENQIHN